MGSEPTDALRVVNVLLTQLDRLKARQNVLIMTTSNLLEASDPAFLSRADVIQYIGPPGIAVTYAILRSCLLELIRSGVILSSSSLLLFDEARSGSVTECSSCSKRLLQVAQACAEPSKAVLSQSMRTSGRGLRNMPVLAYARLVQEIRPCSLEEFICALEDLVKEEMATT